jgi:hypothetical protein
MRKIYTLLGCLLLSQLSNKLSAQVIFSEDFSSATGTTPPAGWSNNDMTMAGTPYLWAFDNPGGAPLNAPITPPAAIFDNNYLGWNGDYPESALESPTFDASVITDYIYLSFDHSFFNDQYGEGSYSVEVWDGSSWNSVFSGYGDVLNTQHVLLDITADANGASDAQVRFVWSGDYSYYWIVDNVQVEVTTCPAVTNGTVDNTTANSADISWTAIGSELSWNIEYGMSGFVLGSGTPGTSSSESFSAGSLTANTSYDFYVQADCGGSNSPWYGPITVFTGYCQYATTETDYFINNFVTTGGADANISNLNSGISGGYEDATAMTVSQFEGGPNINFSVDFGLSGYTYGFGIWVDWNDNLIFESSEQMFQSINGYQDNFIGSFGVPIGTAVGSHRMRILADYWDNSPQNPCTTDSGEGEIEDYTFVVVPIPTCLPVSDLETSNETTTSIDISWTPGDTETDWNIEWGLPGFTPGTGTGVDSAQQSSTASFTVGSLNSSTNYDIYVQASCSSTDSSYWTLVSGVTLCAPITSLPWTENFDAMTQLDYDLFPNCWISENGDWYTDDINNNISYNASPYSGNNFLGIRYYGDDHVWTPEFQLTAGKLYEFSFMWAGDNYDGWNGEVFVNDQQSSSGATSLGAEFVTMSDAESTTYRRAYYCFTPTTTGAYSFGLYVYSNYNPNNLTFDDFSLVERRPSAGTGGSLSVCQINGMVDLNTIITKDDQDGIFTFAPNPTAIVNDSMFNPQYVPAGLVTVNYVTLGCLEDTASAMITIYPPSSAGIDGNITACKSEPIDLLSGLSGTVNLGGDWYNPTNNLMPNSQVITGNFPGQFNYKYITGNGVCPNDTSSVVVTVLGTCNWLSVDENALESMNLYPNPSTGLVYIESTLSTGSFNLTITDINGRVIETGSNSIKNGVNTVNLNNVQRGTYFFKLSNENAEKVYRVVIQ